VEFIIQNLDSIIKLALAGAAAYGFFLGLRFEIQGLKTDINHIKENQRSLAEAFTQLGNILTKVAVQDTRIQMIEKKLDELSHGQGFVRVSKT